MKTAKIVLALMCAALIAMSSTGAQAQAPAKPPLVGSAPQGYAWWCSSMECIMLPTDARPGPQTRFLLVVGGNRMDTLLIGLMGGGEVIWQGGLRADGLDWQAKLARGNGRRSFIGLSTDDAWTFAAMSPDTSWGQDAEKYNAVLRGEVK